MTETQEKIIEAAEIEFALKGFEGASVREITRRAGVNVAAVNYHFGSKKELFKAMLRRRMEPLNTLRMRLLDEAIAQNGGAPLPLQTVVGLIVRPVLAALVGKAKEERYFLKAVGRGLSEEKQFMIDLREDIMKEPLARFAQAIMGSLGTDDPQLCAYGMQLLACTFIGSMTQHERLVAVAGEDDAAEVDAVADRLVIYIAGGLTALRDAQINRPPAP